MLAIIGVVRNKAEFVSFVVIYRLKADILCMLTIIGIVKE